jgi:2,3-bisphosphoglycerate-independent phosphoglycerate mutase
MTRPRPVVLAILDGWGHRDETEHNAIAKAATPCIDALVRDYPHGLINASELHVGLPEGQMGNSEVGHMNIGSGRVLMQDLPKIDQAVADGSLEKNPELQKFIKKVGGKGIFKKPGAVHLMGLVSPGGIHSHQNHIAALAKIVGKSGTDVWIHVFTDGRDTPPKSAQEYVAWLQHEVKDLPNVKVATVSGRYYAMDRDKRWDRTAKAYHAITEAKGDRAPDAMAAIRQSYANNVTDEFIPPTVIGDYPGMQNGDGILMGNFRADRARQILNPFVEEADTGDFEPSYIPMLASMLGMTKYSDELYPFMGTLFQPERLNRILGEVISQAGMKQLRIAETEKYAHVTFFFNGGREKEFPGEERILVPSPKVATYDEKPEMSAYEVTDKLVAAIESDKFDFIVVNYANTDMVGHTGDIEAARKAVEAVDKCLGRVSKATLAKGGAMLITADHGNAEMMHDHDTGQAHTAHTLNLVPAIVVMERYKGRGIKLPEGKLGDVAPTLLQLMGMKQPKEMTGRSLLASHAA